jgi:hypothetical protein
VISLIDEEAPQEIAPGVIKRKFVSDSGLPEESPSKNKKSHVNLFDKNPSPNRMPLNAAPFIPKSVTAKSNMNPINTLKIQPPQSVNYYNVRPPGQMGYTFNNSLIREINPQSNQFFLPQYNSNPPYIPLVMQMVPVPMVPPQVNIGSNGINTGILKFFDDDKNYGFFVLDNDGSDLFVHYDDLLKAGLGKEGIRLAKVSGTKFAFQSVSYYGKHNLSKKAINIQLLGNLTPLTTMYNQMH